MNLKASYILLVAVSAGLSIPVLYKAHGASGTVSVTLTFDTAPSDLFTANTLQPRQVQDCEAMRARIRQHAKFSSTRRHTLKCKSPPDMPLIISGHPGNRLIVRP